jgi:3-deoxy-D-manno-octulosonate 8-phosphate phosphatase (KDO 8-P phosphatase)
VRDASFHDRCQALKLVLSDVDGVMTDGKLVFLSGGGEAKSFHVRDGLGLALARSVGLRTGLVSGRTSAVVETRAAELAMDVVRQGVADKRACLEELRTALGLELREIAYMGDDLNDLSLLREVGLSAAPADAPFEVREAAAMVTEARGGEGCLREFLEAVLRARGEWDRAMAAMGGGPS